MYQQIISILEQTLITIGINPSEARVHEGQYNISKDKHTEVLLDVWEEHGRVFFQALSPVSKLNDTNRAEVLLMLLEENHGMVESAFAISKNDILIKETIECSELFTQQRVISSISRIAYYSETYRNKWAMPS